ncbi:hypothetical protein IQ273_04010 [Nodosilinea sp. LEGE 07298]|uniref:hypothetical protein n=1 Tax=Nodosilinea sp. LEGE 07298 TaxID=2777970 RepID=UPI00187EB272|nr:hypothetical protein [Nodosilinea sp. LEGE 07298]MBE9108581.1 hypothetical protein [Nodosilinea sp. LEGE 07298]
MATRLWNFLTTDSRALTALDVADAADVVLGLAAVLAAEGPSSQKLAPLVNHLDSLLDAINAPLGKLIGTALPIASVGTGLLMFYAETTKQEPTLAQSVALVSQAAYLESFREFARQHPKIEQWLTAKDGTPQAKTITLPVKALGLFELTDQATRSAVLHFHQSDLAKAFNSALRARLIQLGATPEQANRMTEVVAKNTNRHLRSAIAAAKDSFQHQFDCDRP